MPTGLTGDIYDGKDMTLRGFALRCMTQTGFGSAWTDRGERAMPLDKAPVMKEDGYCRKALHHAEEELARWQRLKDQSEELQREYDAYCTKVELENIGRDKRYNEKYVRKANEYFKGLYALLDAAEPITTKISKING